MRLGLTVNRITDELGGYTTTRVAVAATAHGHEVYYLEPGDFSVASDGHLFADALAVPHRTFRSGDVLLRELLGSVKNRHRLSLDDLDVLFLRHNPNDDVFTRPWARMAPLDFAMMAAERGVIVLNNPRTLATALTKLYLNRFDPDLRPDTLVTRNRDEAKRFIADHGGYAVFKPLFGYGGHNVFAVRPEDAPNVNQMFEAVSDDGYVIVQEYLPEGVDGDTRLFVMNGEPLRSHGKIAAVHRARQTGEADIRSNLTAGAKARKATVTDEMLEIVDRLRPGFVADGIFLAGVDIVGSKILEINIMTPGTLYHADRLEDANFTLEVLEAIEYKVDLVKTGKVAADDVALATMAPE